VGQVKPETKPSAVPYDFLAFNETSSIKFEVKGTTSAGEKVIEIALG